MIEKWMETAIENRVLEAVKYCDNQELDSQENFNKILKDLKDILPYNEHRILLELEDSLIQTNIDFADKSYRLGFEDALRLVHPNNK
ncbi:hypothetical protein ACIFQM_00740 [Paenibacillus sp. NRS-1782]|uniref:hypothetical protein n=1 Tax=unclassified Paenibacillus TaxID=185978 RepID=UPI003D29D85A